MNIAFIDGQNLHYGTGKVTSPWKVDLKRFRVYLEEKYKVEEAYYFIGAYDAQHQDLYNYIQKIGYILVFREHTNSLLSKKKGNVDTDIVFTIMKQILENEVQGKIVLVSGDGDYWRLVQYLISKDLFEKLLAPNKRGTSSLYKRIPDSFIAFLDDEEVKKKIQEK